MCGSCEIVLSYINTGHIMAWSLMAPSHKLNQCGPRLLTPYHYGDVIMTAMPSQITGVWIVYPAVCSGRDQRKHQSSISLAFVRGIHRWMVDSPHKRPVMWKMFHLMMSSCSAIMPQFHHWPNLKPHSTTGVTAVANFLQPEGNSFYFKLCTEHHTQGYSLYFAGTENLKWFILQKNIPAPN